MSGYDGRFARIRTTPTPHGYGGRLLRRVPDVRLPLEPRRPVLRADVAPTRPYHHPENRVARVLDLIAAPAPVFPRPEIRAFQPAPTPRQPVPRHRHLERTPDVALPLEPRRPVLRADQPVQRPFGLRRDSVARNVFIPPVIQPRPAAIMVQPSVQRRRPEPQVDAPQRVPDVALPLEPRRKVIVGGHSKRLPDHTGVRL